MRALILVGFSLFCLMALLIPVDAFAKEVHYKDYALDVHEGDRLVLIGMKGNVHVEPAASGGGVMRVKKTVSDKAGASEQAAFDGLSFDVRREGAALVVEQRAGAMPWPLDVAAGAAQPELDYEILMPQAPAEIAVRNAHLIVRNWKQPLALEVVTGSITTSGTEGPIRLQIQKGSVQISEHRGRVEIDSNDAKVTVKDVEGDVEVQNFSGESVLSGITGAVDVHSHSGLTSISQSSGTLDFITGRGPLTISDFEGALRGQSDQGAVTASLIGDLEVRIESNQGAVNLKLPSDSGATVRLSTEDGSLSAPEDVKSNGHSKVMSGRLKGAGGKGTVAVKNKSGTVHIRL